MTLHRSRLTRAAVAASFCSVALLTACGSDDSAGASPGASASGAAKKIVVGTSGDFPPLSSLDAASGDIVGFENDMMKSVTAKLGWTFEWSQVSFTGLIPALQSGRLDAIVSGMYHTEERAKKVDFVDYMQVPLSVLTATADAAATTSPAALCGKSVAYLIASPPELTQIKTWSAECTAAGKKAVDGVGFDSVSQAVNAVSSGRVFAELEGDIVTLYISQTQFDNKLSVAFNVEGGNHTVGLATAQGSAIQADLTKGIEEWVASGEYCATAKLWKLSASDTLRSCA
jgi:polar amino acid transport system substrate-binding protein